MMISGPYFPDFTTQSHPRGGTTAVAAVLTVIELDLSEKYESFLTSITEDYFAQSPGQNRPNGAKSTVVGIL